MLLLQAPSRNMFFWMQEPEMNKDEELLLRCNISIHGMTWHPPGAASTVASSALDTTAVARRPSPAPAGKSNAALSADQLHQCASPVF
jgi:hypothetical protein